MFTFSISHDLLFGPVIKLPVSPGKFKRIAGGNIMEMLEQTLDSSQDKSNDSADTEDIPLSATVDSDLVCKVKQELNQLESSGMELSGTVEADLDHADEQAAAIASVQQQGTITLDPTLQYQIRADNSAGQVTYRVVQVAHDGSDASQLVGGAAAYAGQQAVIQSPFSNGGSPTGDANDARFAYFPAPTATDGTVVAAQGGDTIATGATLGQFYVMMSPQDVLQGQRQIAPRTSFSPKLEGGGIRTARDDRRRATHNEVERRRRDKINNWIVQLSKLVPDCAQEPIKQTQASKGGILSKACEYIQELRSTNNRLAESLKEAERINVDNELLRQQCEELKQENAFLRSHLQQNGIDLGPGPS